jgi:protein-disulfide isomerase
MKRYLPFVIVILVGLLAVGGGAMFYRAKRQAALASAKNLSASARTESGHLHIRGELNAPVTVEEFGDFQCPPCATLSPMLDDVERQYRPRVRLVFRNFPLPMHVHAAEAAYAAEAAGKQGRFWEMHDLLYREQAVWSKATEVQTIFSSYAGMLGLNVDRFKADMQSPAIKSIVESDHKEGSERGVKSTPTVFVNNVALEPNTLTKTGLNAAIDSALKEAPASKSK